MQADDVIEGFVYVDETDSGPMAQAAVGARVVKDSIEPPWIVVNHSLERVIVARWPGRLFRVAVVPPATDAGRAAMARAAAALTPGAGYTRSLAVDVVEELRPSILFGRYGDAVVEVIEAGRSLTEQTAQRLATAQHPAYAAYRAVWARWLSRQPDGPPYQPQDHSRTLAVPGAGPAGSPVRAGLMLLYTVVSESARQRGGAGAVVVDRGNPQ